MTEDGEVIERRLLSFNGTLFFYPALYYPHKNHKIIFELAKEAKKQSLNWKFLITLQDCKYEKDFMNDVMVEGLCDYIENLGFLGKKQLKSYYTNSQYLFMPTQMETFGLPYIEAMYQKLPILTSDLDFARDLCRDAANYFNPLDVRSIFDCIIKSNDDYERMRDCCLSISREYDSILKTQKSLIDIINE